MVACAAGNVQKSREQRSPLLTKSIQPSQSSQILKPGCQPATIVTTTVISGGDDHEPSANTSDHAEHEEGCSFSWHRKR